MGKASKIVKSFDLSQLGGWPVGGKSGSTEPNRATSTNISKKMKLSAYKKATQWDRNDFPFIRRQTSSCRSTSLAAAAAAAAFIVLDRSLEIISWMYKLGKILFLYQTSRLPSIPAKFQPLTHRIKSELNPNPNWGLWGVTDEQWNLTKSKLINENSDHTPQYAYA